MKNKHSWSDWWREFFGFPGDSYRSAMEFISERYLEKAQHVARFHQQAERMQYPQFRQKLLASPRMRRNNGMASRPDRDLGCKTAGPRADSRD
ncbi:MAG TPA: hypothetical protein VGH22_12365 [Candidatus Binatia bacterium]|jgi:hypothetical protein